MQSRPYGGAAGAPAMGPCGLGAQQNICSILLYLYSLYMYWATGNEWPQRLSQRVGDTDSRCLAKFPIDGAARRRRHAPRSHCSGRRPAVIEASRDFKQISQPGNHQSDLYWIFMSNFICPRFFSLFNFCLLLCTCTHVVIFLF